jgi:DNA-binding transcriptional MocR family regulator
MAGAAEERLLAELRRLAVEQSAGSRLPSVRELSRRHRASPVTVAGAIARLAAEGLAVARPGRGTFVAERPSPPQEPVDLSWQAIALGAAGIDPGGLEALLAFGGEDTIVLSSGFVDGSLLPIAALAAAATRAARRPGAWGRLPVDGLQELRAWFAREAGGGLEAADVFITSGGQSALATSFRALGRRGDPLLVESPTYVGALAAARGAGLVPVPVPVDQDGVRTDLLADALARTGARLMMLQPTYANPHGAVLSESRRGAVLELARAHGAFVIEDEYVRDLGLDRRPPPPSLVSRDVHGHVVYIRSLTKATAPSLRVAAVAARGAAGERLRRARIVDDFFVSGVLQHTAVELVTSPAWQRHLRQLRRTLTGRRDTLITALAEHLPAWQVFQRPAGGLCLWIRLPDGADEDRLVQNAAAAGVLVLPGRPWFPAEPPAPHLRLSYAAASEPRLREAAQRLAIVSGSAASASG